MNDNIMTSVNDAPEKNESLLATPIVKNSCVVATIPSSNNPVNQIEIKNDNIQSAIQICTDDGRKIFISGPKSLKEIPVQALQHILNSLNNGKTNQTFQLITKESKVNGNDQMKGIGSADENGLQNSPPKVNGNVTKSVVKDDKIKIEVNDRNLTVNKSMKKVEKEEKKCDILKDEACNKEHAGNKQKNCHDTDSKNVNAGTKIIKKSTSENVMVKPTNNLIDHACATKPKKFLYKLKSKNGKILSYISDVPITLKKPNICLDKMTQQDAERLSKQFAAEKMRKRKTKVKSDLDNDKSKVVSDSSVVSQQSYGIQTRKRQLKFLPDGRIVRGEKSKKRMSSGSSLSSIENDDLDLDKPVVTSDEDYDNSSVHVASSDDDFDDPTINSKNPKKTSPKQTNSDKNARENGNESTKCSSRLKWEEFQDPKNLTPLSAIQYNKVCNIDKTQKKTLPDPATIFSTLLQIPISSNQLSIRKFKPSIKNNQENTNNVFVSKKVISGDSVKINSSIEKKIRSSNESKNVSFKSNIKSSKVNENPVNISKKEVSENSKESFSMKSTAVPNNTPPPLKKILPKTLPDLSYPNPPPLAPLSNKITSVSTNVNNKPSVKSVTTKSLSSQSSQNSSKFEGFTDTKIVKTKEGPKKAISAKLGQANHPKTIYDVMDEIFDIMPNWNIHVIPENKSFCLAQIAHGRTGVPILKKSIEINSEFMAKVYVHQLHCKRYDGIYDTESKVKKLIHDVDALAS